MFRVLVLVVSELPHQQLNGLLVEFAVALPL
jgi:hypothetical protein